MKYRKKIFVRAYTAVNLGDDIFLKVLFDRYPNCDFILLAFDDCYKKIFSDYKHVRVVYFNIIQNYIIRIVLRLFANKQYIAAYIYKIFVSKYACKCDAYVHIGGSIFIQNTPNISYKDFCFRNVVKLFADKPKFIIGANFGPFVNNLYKEFYMNLFKEFTDICFREKFSYSLFKRLSNVRYTVDVVFQYILPKVQLKQNTVGFSVIQLKNRKNLQQYCDTYYNLICKLILKVIEQGKTPYLISFCKMEGDEEAINYILSLLPSESRNKIKLLLYNGDFDTFIQEYVQIESMFCSRFHATILSLLCEQYIYPITYSSKTVNMLSDLNFSDILLQISDMGNRGNIDDLKILADLQNNKFKLKAEPLLASKQFLQLDYFALQNRID